MLIKPRRRGFLVRRTLQRDFQVRLQQHGGAFGRPGPVLGSSSAPQEVQVDFSTAHLNSLGEKISTWDQWWCPLFQIRGECDRPTHRLSPSLQSPIRRAPGRSIVAILRASARQ